MLFRLGGTSDVWSMWTQVTSTSHFTVCFNYGFWQCLFLCENGESQRLLLEEPFFPISSWHICVALVLSTAEGTDGGETVKNTSTGIEE